MLLTAARRGEHLGQLHLDLAVAGAEVAGVVVEQSVDHGRVVLVLELRLGGAQLLGISCLLVEGSVRQNLRDAVLLADILCNTYRC